MFLYFRCHIFIDIAVRSTKLVAMAMQICNDVCIEGGGEGKSILLTVIGKNLFFGYPDKLIPM